MTSSVVNSGSAKLFYSSVSPTASSAMRERFIKVFRSSIAPVLVKPDHVMKRIINDRYHSRLFFEDQKQDSVAGSLSIDKQPFKFLGEEKALRLHFVHAGGRRDLELELLKEATSFATDQKAQSIFYILKPGASYIKNLLSGLGFETAEQSSKEKHIVCHKNLSQLQSNLESQSKPQIKADLKSHDPANTVKRDSQLKTSSSSSSVMARQNIDKKPDRQSMKRSHDQSQKSLDLSSTPKTNYSQDRRRAQSGPNDQYQRGCSSASNTPDWGEGRALKRAHRMQSSTVPVDKRSKQTHTYTMMNRKDAPYMDWIRTGEKLAEGRINSKGFERLRVGDFVRFHNRREGIVCEITFLHRYNGFKEMLVAEGPLNMLPQLKKMRVKEKDYLDSGVKIYQGFPGSQRVQRMGALAIGVKYLGEMKVGDRR